MFPLWILAIAQLGKPNISLLFRLYIEYKVIVPCNLLLVKTHLLKVALEESMVGVFSAYLKWQSF